MPLEEFRETQRAAVLAAGNGRATFADVYPIHVVFAIADGRTDVMLEGDNKDGAWFSHGVIGRTTYVFERDATVEPVWVATSLDDDSERSRFVVQGAEELRDVGTPLALIDGLVGVDPTVLEAAGDRTTYAAQVSEQAYVNATSLAGPVEPGSSIDVRWSVDAADRPVDVVAPTWSYDDGVHYSDWGTTPALVPPEGAVTWDELIDRLTGGTV